MLLPMHSSPSSSFGPNTPRTSPPPMFPPSTPTHIPWLSSPSSNVTPHTYLTPSPAGSSMPSFPQHHRHNSDSHLTTPKRDRTDSESITSEASHNASYQQVVEIQQPLVLPSSNKKSRGNAYIASRPVTKSFNSTMGSLVGLTPCISTNASSTSTSSSVTACASNLSNNPNLRVHMRRQLSGSQLDPFLGDHDDMEVEAADSRPRSMSF
jgi:hypothetical protein